MLRGCIVAWSLVMRRLIAWSLIDWRLVVRNLVPRSFLVVRWAQVQALRLVWLQDFVTLIVRVGSRQRGIVLLLMVFNRASVHDFSLHLFMMSQRMLILFFVLSRVESGLVHGVLVEVNGLDVVLVVVVVVQGAVGVVVSVILNSARLGRIMRLQMHLAALDVEIVMLGGSRGVVHTMVHIGLSAKVIFVKSSGRLFGGQM